MFVCAYACLVRGMCVGNFIRPPLCVHLRVSVYACGCARAWACVSLRECVHVCMSGLAWACVKARLHDFMHVCLVLYAYLCLCVHERLHFFLLKNCASACAHVGVWIENKRKI